MLSDIATSSEAESKARMDELNKKIQALEKAKKEKERRDMLQKQALEAQRENQNKGFLAGIKSFQVEDIWLVS